MRQRTRRRVTRLASTGIVLTAATGLLGFSAPAMAVEAPYYTASSSASLLHVSALNANPLGVNVGPLVDLKVSTSGSSADSKRSPRTEAAAAQLDLAVNQASPDIPQSTVQQSAPPDHNEAKTVNAQALDLGVAKLGLGHMSAHARWNDSCANPTDEVELTNSSASLADVTVLPGSQLGGLTVPGNVPLTPQTSVLALPSTGLSQSKTSIVDVEDQDALGVKAESRISLAQIVLFDGTANETRIKVISPPTLTAVAAGTDNSYVDYKAPILEISTADGTKHRLESPHAMVEIPLALAAPANTSTNAAPADGAEANTGTDTAQVPSTPSTPLDSLLNQLLPGVGSKPSTNGGGSGGSAESLPRTPSNQPVLLRLSLADLTKTVSNTHVSGEAASVRLQILDVPGSGSLLDVALGQLKVDATAPDGGVTGPEPTPTTTATTSPSSDKGKGDHAGGKGGGKGNLPLTGPGVGLAMAAGVVLIALGGTGILLARRRSATIAS